MIHPIIGVLGKTVSKVPAYLLKNDEGKALIRQKWAKEILHGLGYEIEIVGKPSISRSHILVGNHISFLDIPVLLATFPNAVFIAKDDLKKWPILGACIATAGTIFISREKGADRAFARKIIVETLTSNTNLSVVVFPSGTTSLDENVTWKKGIFEIAKTAKVPIQSFRITYNPLRESAYIDDDHLLSKLKEMSQLDKKSVTITWLDAYEDFESPESPESLAEEIRKKVQKNE